jgi:hypothetical protein
MSHGRIILDIVDELSINSPTLRNERCNGEGQMKALTVLALSLLLTACSLTPRQKAFVVGSVLLSGALAAHSSNSNQDRRVGLPANACGTPEACR